MNAKDNFIESASSVSTVHNSPFQLLYVPKTFTQKVQDLATVNFLSPLKRENEEDQFSVESSIKNIETLQKEILYKKENDNFYFISSPGIEVPEFNFKEKEIIKPDSKNATTRRSLDDFKKGSSKRKFSLDSFHKKIKRNYFNYILNNVLLTYNIHSRKKEQRDISNVTIQYCQSFLNMTISEFIVNYCDVNFNELSQKVKKKPRRIRASINF